MRAVVFAYSNVGDRCLRVLRARGVDVALVVTNTDAAGELMWFSRVADTAAELGIPVIVADDPSVASVAERVTAARADIVFSFYYRAMIPVALFEGAWLGAFNMHGSMLPKYRGRAPTNWAVLHGEIETGATLHDMVQKPDAGSIVDQLAVPILPDDTAEQVFNKVTVAAEQVLWRTLPTLERGNAARMPNHLGDGSYFSGRKPEDGRIDWSRPAREVYNLIRAVAPPYPGAFEDLAGTRVVVGRARLRTAAATGVDPARIGFQVVGGKVIGICGDGNLIDVIQLQIDGRPIDSKTLLSLLNASPKPSSAA